MQAVMYDRFGDDSVLSLRETAVPEAAHGEVQVRMDGWNAPGPGKR